MCSPYFDEVDKEAASFRYFSIHLAGDIPFLASQASRFSRSSRSFGVSVLAAAEELANENIFSKEMVAGALGLASPLVACLYKA